MEENDINKFEALNFNLKKIVFNYLSPIDLVKICFLNLRTRKLITKFYNNITVEVIKVFLFLNSLKNFNFFKRNNNKSHKYHINYLEEFPLFSITIQKFPDLKLENIINGIVYFVNSYLEVFRFKTLLIDFSDPLEVEIFKSLVTKLNREDFFYTLEYKRKLNYTNDPSFKADLLLILKNIKFVYNHISNFNFFEFLLHNKIEVYIYKSKSEFNPKSYQNDVRKYFVKYPNHQMDYCITYLDLISFNPFEILRLNSKCIKKIQFRSIPFEKDIKEIEKNLPEGLQNLTKIKFSKCAPTFLESVIFKKVKSIHMDCISFNHMNTLLFNSEVNENENSLTGCSKSNLIIDKIKKIKLHMEDHNKFNQFPFCNFKNLPKEMNINALLYFKSLKKVSILYPDTKGSFYFWLDKIFMINNFNNFDAEILNLLTMILKNNSDNKEDLIIDCNSIKIIKSFFLFLSNHNYCHIKDRINGLRLLDSDPTNEKFDVNFEKILSLETSNLSILKNFKLVDRLYLEKSDFIYDQDSLLNPILCMKVKVLKINYDDKFRILNLICNNINKFHFLNILELPKILYEFSIVKNYLESLIIMNLLYLKIKIKINKTEKEDNLVNKLAKIKGVELIEI
jgi:hypothetical protein